MGVLATLAPRGPGPGTRNVRGVAGTRQADPVSLSRGAPVPARDGERTGDAGGTRVAQHGDRERARGRPGAGGLRGHRRLHPAGRQVGRGALGGRADGPARPAGRRRRAARPGAGDRVLPRRRPDRRGRPPQRGRAPSCRCRPRWPATPAWPRPSAAAGLAWVGPDAEVLERLGGDGVEPASERGFLAWVTADGLRFTTAVSRDRAAGIARVSWTPQRAPWSCPRPPAGWPRSAGAGWSPSGIDPGRRARRGGRRLLPRHGRAGARARRRRGRARAAQCGRRRRRRRRGSPTRAAVAVQLRAGAAAGHAGTGHRPAARHRAAARRSDDGRRASSP